MSTFTLWDIPSSTLLVETAELDTISTTIRSYVADNGQEALDDLVLGVELDATLKPAQHTGSDILRVLGEEESRYAKPGRQGTRGQG
jgi:hypothetical protein